MEEVFIKHLPSPRLSHLIDYFWLWKSENPDISKFPDRFIPDGHFEIFIDLKDMFAQLDESGEWTRAPASFVGGMYTSHFFVKSGDSIFRVGVVVRPGMIQHLINEDLTNLKGKNTDLKDLWGNMAESLMDQLACSQSNVHIFNILENYLIKVANTNKIDRAISTAVREIIRTQGNITVKSLAENTHMSIRQFRRRFQDKIGVSPKQYMKIIRISYIARLTLCQKFDRLTDLAYEAGFSDQSHLTREFKSIAGINPNGFRQEPHPIFDNLIKKYKTITTSQELHMKY